MFLLILISFLFFTLSFHNVFCCFYKFNLRLLSNCVTTCSCSKFVFFSYFKSTLDKKFIFFTFLGWMFVFAEREKLFLFLTKNILITVAQFIISSGCFMWCAILDAISGKVDDYYLDCNCACVVLIKLFTVQTISHFLLSGCSSVRFVGIEQTFSSSHTWVTSNEQSKTMQQPFNLFFIKFSARKASFIFEKFMRFFYNSNDKLRLA